MPIISYDYVIVQLQIICVSYLFLIECRSEKKPVKGGLMSWLVKSPKKETQTEDKSAKKENGDNSEKPAKRQKID